MYFVDFLGRFRFYILKSFFFKFHTVYFEVWKLKNESDNI